MAAEGKERVVVVQDGTRLRYAVPVGLQRRGSLERVYADWYAKGGVLEGVVGAVANWIRPGAGKRLRERCHPELDSRRVWRAPGLVVKQAAARRRFETSEEHWAWCSERVGEWVLRKGFGGATGLHGFVRNISPGLCTVARSRGVSVVVDQMIAPMHEERRQQEIQEERFPEWRVAGARSSPRVVEQVEERTWGAAHHVTCASEYVRGALIDCGLAAEKITVLPYPLEVGQFEFGERGMKKGQGVTVGFVGAVGLRKGVPYLMEVARRLPGVRFELVGPVTVPSALLSAENVTVVGTVARSEVAGRMAGWDMLLFPSTCEGSAVAVMEAMASGLPVVTSPNSGSAVRDGVEGYVREYDDVEGMTGAVERLAGDVSLRREMGRAGRKRVEGLTVDGYVEGLLNVFAEIRAHRA